MLATSIVIHGLPDALSALETSPRATLRSAPGAAGFAGALWWRELIALARAQTGWQGAAYVDCGSNGALAVEAIRCGVVHLILDRDCPNFQDISELAVASGGEVHGRECA